ncbi:hypothetical protein SFC43_25840 [Bacteroides sp. CR5/BHMF/2]|nr:hypothetical protein [Bacteroides sp. CR5/BHMF/2]
MVAGDFNSYNEYDKKAYGPKFETERLQFSPTVAINYEVTNFMLENGFKDAFTLFSDGHFKQSIPVTITEFPKTRDAGTTISCLARTLLLIAFMQTFYVKRIRMYYPTTIPTISA